MGKTCLVIILISFLSLKCEKNLNTIEFDSKELEGLWKTSGIIIDDEYPDKGKEIEYHFRNGTLQMLTKDYRFDSSSNNWILQNYYANYFIYNNDHNYLILVSKDDPTITYPVALYYTMNNNILNISSGMIYKGDSNNFLNTIWEFKISYYQERKLESYIFQEIYYDNNNGIRITNYLNENHVDTTGFIYTVNGNEINISYQNPNIQAIYNFEIKDNKFYRNFIHGNIKDDFEVTLTKHQGSPNNNDFLPLKVGNTWSYKYYYCQPFCFTSTNGIIKWTVIKENNLGFEIQEIINGFNVSNSNMDTVYFGPDTSYFSIQLENQTVTLQPVFFNSGKVRFNRFYELTDEHFLISLTSSDGVSQAIELTKEVGITKWSFGGTHNSEEYGRIDLIR